MEKIFHIMLAIFQITSYSLYYTIFFIHSKHIPNHQLIEVESRTVDDGVKLVYLDDPSHFHDHVVEFAADLRS